VQLHLVSYLVSYCFNFLADRTNGRTYGTMMRLSVVCKVCIVAITVGLPKNCLKKEIGLAAYLWYQF